MREPHFRGWRDRFGCHVDVVDTQGKARPLPNVVNHTRGRWEWDTARPRLNELALSILAQALGEDPSLADLRAGQLECVRLADDFVWELLPLVRGNHWELCQKSVVQYVFGRNRTAAQVIPLFKTA